MPRTLHSTNPDHELDGVFGKDPDLKDKLCSGPCVAAALQIQHAFEMEHTSEECDSIIEAYAALGGDGGLTEQSMLKACCLHQKTPQSAPGLSGLAGLADSHVQGDTEPCGLRVVADALAQALLEDRRDGISFYHFKKFKLPPNSPSSLSREELWSQLVEAGLMRLVVSTGKCKELLIPVIHTENTYESVCPAPPSSVLFLPEQYKYSHLWDYAYGHKAREPNAVVVGEYLQEKVDQVRALNPQKKGR